MARFYSNVSKVMTLSAPVGLADVTCTVNDASGLPASFPYNIAIDYEASSVEIVSVTAAAGNVLTITRGQEDTAASTHAVGATVVHAATALDFQDAQAHYAATSNVHGTGAGTVVGTSTAQTLTNKTISGAANTITNIAAGNVTGTFNNLVTSQTNAASPGLKVNAAVTPTANVVEIGGDIVVFTDAKLRTAAGVVSYSQRWYGANFASQVAEMSSAGLLTVVGVTSSGLINANAGLTVPSGQTLTVNGGGFAAINGTLTVSGTLTVNSGVSVNFNSGPTFGNNQTTTWNTGTTIQMNGTTNLNAAVNLAGTVTATGTVNLNGPLQRDSSAAKPLMYSSTSLVPAATNMATGGSFADVPGLSDTFTVPASRSATVEVTFNVDGLCNTAGNTQEWLPVIDGTAYQGATAGMALTWAAAANLALTFSFTTTLTAGSHTIKIQERRTAGAAAINYKNPWSNMVLKVFW